MAYLSRLTYHLARSESLDRDALTCPACQRDAKAGGWCDACGLGIVGNVSFRDRGDYDAMVREVEILREAVRRSATCETCAAALVADGRCPVHRIQFKDGREVPPPEPGPEPRPEP